MLKYKGKNSNSSKSHHPHVTNLADVLPTAETVGLTVWSESLVESLVLVLFQTNLHQRNCSHVEFDVLH